MTEDVKLPEQLQAAVLAERERCAVLCESLHSLPRLQGRGTLPIGPNSYSGEDVDSYDETASRIAAAIREGGQ
jgi:hypothetical protein